jgi:hypothetical protein
LVPADLAECASALSVGFAEVAAGTWIHCSDQLELCREVGSVAGAGDADVAGLQRFAQGLQGLPIKLGELIEEQDTMMCEGNLTGRRHCATPDQGDQ